MEGLWEALPFYLMMNIIYGNTAPSEVIIIPESSLGATLLLWGGAVNKLKLSGVAPLPPCSKILKRSNHCFIWGGRLVCMSNAYLFKLSVLNGNIPAITVRKKKWSYWSNLLKWLYYSWILKVCKEEKILLKYDI